MLRNTLLATTLIISSVSLTGCSSIWTKVGDLSYKMSDFTKFSFLRGSSTKSDISFAEASVSDSGVLKTDVGEYVPANVVLYDDVTFDNSASAGVDTSQHECPEDTYLTADNTCTYLETETFDFGDELSVNVQQPIDTGPVPCPEDTYLTADNTCTYLETETFDFGDELSVNVQQPIDTGPVPCPEDTYLTADNTCTYLETETFDFGDELVTDVQAPIDTSPIPCPEGTYLTAENTCTYLETEEFDFAVDPAPALSVPSQDFAIIPPTGCPEGFQLNADNSCMYLGAELKIK